MNRQPSSRKSRKNAAKDVAGKKRKSSGKVAEEQPSSKRVRSPPPSRAPAPDPNDTEEDASAATAPAAVDVSGLQKEIKEMEQSHQYFTSDEGLKYRVKFFVVKFEDRPPDYMTSEYTCIPAQWVQRRNPRKADGGRTAYILCPRSEQQYRTFCNAEDMWDMYKVLFCYSAENRSEAEQYLDKSLLLEKELIRQNGGQPIKKTNYYKFANVINKAY